MTPADFQAVLHGTLGAGDTGLAPDIALRDQLLIESSRIVELAIVLEQDLGADLEDDVDIAGFSPLELHAMVKPEAGA